MPLASDRNADNRNTFRPISAEGSVSSAISLPHISPDFSNLLKYSPESGAPAETARPDFGKSSNVTGGTVPPIQPLPELPTGPQPAPLGPPVSLRVRPSGSARRSSLDRPCCTLTEMQLESAKSVDNHRAFRPTSTDDSGCLRQSHCLQESRSRKSLDPFGQQPGSSHWQF